MEPVEARISVLDGQATLMVDATVIGTPDDVSLENGRVVDLLVREADGTAIGVDGSSASQFANGSTVRVVLNIVPRGGFVFLRGWVAVDGVFAGRYALPAVARVY